MCAHFDHVLIFVNILRDYKYFTLWTSFQILKFEKYVLLLFAICSCTVCLNFNKSVDDLTKLLMSHICLLMLIFNYFMFYLFLKYTHTHTHDLMANLIKKFKP